MTTVLITGASSGIGRATAIRAHQAGLHVIATMRNPADGADLPCQVEQLDVTSQFQVDKLFSGLDLDVLINNAGIGAPGAAEEVPLDVVETVMATNYLGAVRCAQAVIPAMRQRGNGHIINVTSIAGRVFKAMESAYSASKAALEAWTETVAFELAPFGVRVRIIEPGVVKTPILDKEYPSPSVTYKNQWDRFFNIVLSQTRNQTYPDTVADTIMLALRSDSPQLRWQVGLDAELMWNRRQAITDEQVLALSSYQSDDDFWATYQALWGSELTPDIAATR